ncbi:FAD-dependent oxidoreductase [Pseudophaeobacter arcticus]|uniref:FAD-dependent oxidoreductase n=1 Tax=Pseudophaeobacter arcticus TaxID=385492 RepID=UPI000405ADC0|nr:FAD-dependent oxidoreductase [Pseudophaeobacter arcticus]
MTSEVKKVLVIGGGFSGMVAAICLQQRGVAVDLVEIDKDWRTYGAGISLHGATYRLLGQLGLMEAYHKIGGTCDGVHMRGPQDQILAQIPTPPLGPNLPGNGAVMRPALAKILAEKVRAEGVEVRLGVTFANIDQHSGDVEFTDGTADTYDLIVGADGFASAVRAALYADAPAPQYVGQAVWRALVPRPAEIPTLTMWMGPKLKAGINHVSDSQSYLFLTEDKPVNEWVSDEALLPEIKALLAKFPSPVLTRLAEGLSEDSKINYRPLENMMLPRPWSRGRVVLIGDAVHATTPHMAAGALLGMEDGLVLAEAVASNDARDAALAAFEERRYERCRMVVENSARLAEIEVTGGDHAEHVQLMGKTQGALAQPI